MYHQIKFGCKTISSSVDMVEMVTFDYISPKCDLDLEDSKPIFLHDILAHDDASQYQVWSQKVKQLRRYHPDEHSAEFWTIPVTLTLTTTEQSNLFTWQSSLWWCAITPSLFQKDQQFRRYVRKSYFDYVILHCDLDLEDSKPIFLKDNLAHNDALPYQVWQ